MHGILFVRSTPQSITQALDALNFHGASARLQENPATKKLSTLVV